MQLRYFVPFKAQDGVDAQFALKEKLINIEGVAVDNSVNLNKWQIPAEDLDFVVESLLGAQLRVDHAESALMVIGKVAAAKRVGDTVTFTAEVGDAGMIEKIIRNYVTHVSIQVDSEDVECSKCRRITRKEGELVHLCPGAYEVVHKPKVRELSIVASPAYKNTSFSPVGFAAAMDDSQWEAVSRLLNRNKDVGSKGDLQEPENKKDEAKQEVKPLSSEQEQKEASPHKAQKAQVVNVGPGESAPKQVDYAPFLQQLQDLSQQIHQAEGAEADAEIDTLKKHVADLENELAKKATKRSLSKKLSELAKKISEQSEEGEEGQESEEGGNGDGDGGPKPSGPVDVISKRKADEEDHDAINTSKSPYGAGKGIVAVDEVQKDALGNYKWFQDLLKAHSRMVGHK